MIAEGKKQPARYLVSGGLCAIANNILLIAGGRAGMNTFELTLLSFMMIGTVGYLAHVLFTFRQSLTWRGYGRFMIGVALGIPVAYAVLTLLRDLLGLPMLIAAPTATVILLTYNFLSARLAIMRRLFD